MSAGSKSQNPPAFSYAKALSTLASRPATTTTEGITNRASQQSKQAQSIKKNGGGAWGKGGHASSALRATAAGLQSGGDKKKKPKKKTAEDYKVKPRPTALEFSLGDFVKKTKKGQKGQRGGAVAVALETATITQRTKSSGPISANRLDSTAPVIRRGKEREKPKKKRVTPLKKAILLERDRKREALNEGVEAAQQPKTTEGIDSKRNVENASSTQQSDNEAVPEHQWQQEQEEHEKHEEQEEQEEQQQKQQEGQEEQEEHEEQAEQEGQQEQYEKDNQELQQKGEPLKPVCKASDTLMKFVDASPFVPGGYLPETPAVPAISANLQGPSPKPTTSGRRPHSRRFREYCDQLLSTELDQCISALLEKLWQFQKRQHIQNPVKAKMRRRLVIGMRETTKYAVRGKLLAVIIAPDMEKVEGDGGLDEAIAKIKKECAETDTPVCFALNRKKFGRILTRKIPVSVGGILSADGAHVELKMALKLAKDLRAAYYAQPAE